MFSGVAQAGSAVKRLRTGVEGLDDMLSGGLIRRSVTLIKGPPGTGKTSLGMSFIAEGLKQGEPGVIVTFEHFPDKLYRDAKSIGIDLAQSEKNDMLRTVFTSPEVFVSQMMCVDGQLVRMINEIGAARILIDSISHLQRLTPDRNELRRISNRLVNGLLRESLTSVLIQEDEEITGSMNASRMGVSYIVDTVIQLRYIEFESAIHRGILVLKMRASGHNKDIREYQIDGNGLKVGDPFSGREGVLSGQPVKKQVDAFREAFGPKKAGK